MKEKIVNILKVVVLVAIILIAWFGTAIQGIHLFDREYNFAELVLNGALLFVIVGPVVMLIMGIPYLIYKMLHKK